MFLNRPRDYIGAKRDSKTPAQYANPIEAPSRDPYDVVGVVCVILLFVVLVGIAMGKL